MTSKVIETKKVQIQARPALLIKGITQSVIYDATCEVTEYTITNGQPYNTERKSIDNIYVITDDNGEILRSGKEFFREVELKEKE